MGQYLDHHLQPLAQKTRVHLRDSKHLIQLLDEIQMKEGPCLLATADINSLYTIIGHQEVVKATQRALKHLSETPRKHWAYLLESLEYCLSHNYFWHDNTYYKQVKGITMGTNFTPSVANIFMAE